MKKTFSLLLSLLSFVSLGDELRPTTELNDVPGTSTLREMFKAGGGDGSATTNDLQDATNLIDRIKRDKDDLAVYEVVRTENTNWTWTSENAEFAHALNEAGTKPEWNGHAWWYVNLPSNYSINMPVETGQSVTSITYDVSKIEEIPVLARCTATRPRYMDEHGFTTSTNAVLAEVVTNGTGKVTEGDLVKVGTNGRLVKATASDIPELPYLSTKSGGTVDGYVVFNRLVVCNSEIQPATVRAMAGDVLATVDGNIHNLSYKADRATTLSGYGITDAATKTELAGYLPLSGGTMSGTINMSGNNIYTDGGIIAVGDGYLNVYGTGRVWFESASLVSIGDYALPAYLSSGNWNTADDPFAKVSQLPTEDEKAEWNGKLDKTASGEGYLGSISWKDEHTLRTEQAGIEINGGNLDVHGFIKADLWSDFSASSDTGGNLPAYLDSLAWRTTGNRTLSDYGITDGVTKTEVVPLWVAGHVYNAGDTVLYNGAYYRAMFDDTSSSPDKTFSYWEPITFENVDVYGGLSVHTGDLSVDNGDLELSGGGITVNSGFEIKHGINKVVYGISVNGGAAQHGDVSIDIPAPGNYAAVSNAAMSAVQPWQISHTNAMFSNAVLAVQIDTNTVAQIGELKAFFDGLPTGTVGTSLGGIILALLGAAAWLKKNKADKSDTYTKDETDAAIHAGASLGQMMNLGDGRYEYTGALTDASTQTYPREEA